MTEDDKYQQRPEPTASDVALGSALPASYALKKLGGGSTWQGAKKVASGLGQGVKLTADTAKAGYRMAGGVGGLWKGAKALGGVATRAAVPVMALIANANTPSEDYYERFGYAPYDDSRGAWGHFGIRALGYMSDLGDAATFGQLGKYTFKDKIRQNNEAQAQIQQAQDSQTQQNPPKANNPFANTPIQTMSNHDLDKVQNAFLAPPTAQNDTPKQGGLSPNNANYDALVKKVQAMQQQALADKQPQLGIATTAPRRDWQNEAQRKALMQEATTPIKGARGLTANQLRLAHELTNDDIKLAQERHLQQNQLNHQLLQEQLQQEGQNARTLAGEQGQMARALMNEQGSNDRFRANLGLDIARFNQDSQNHQYELGIKGADLRSRLESVGFDNQAKAEQISLYQKFANAKDDNERNKILTQMAVLQGKVPSNGHTGTLKDNFITVKNAEGGEDLIDLRTLQQAGGDKPIDYTALEKEMAQAGTAKDKQAILSQYGVSPEEYQAILAIIEQRQAQKAQGA